MKHTNDVIVERAEDADARRRNRLEVYGRRWAAEQGVPVPRIIDYDEAGSWLVSERAHFRPAEGPDYIEAALESAERIAAGSRPDPPGIVTGWRNPRRWASVLRGLKLSASGVSPHTFLAARRAASELPIVVPSHGDFHVHNVLDIEPGPDGSCTAATVIDFEYLQLGSQDADAVRLLSTVESHADAAYGVDLLVRKASRREWPTIAVQLRWLGLRQWAEVITGPDDMEPERPRASERWKLTRKWAQEIERACRTAPTRTPELSIRRERRSNGMSPNSSE